MVQKRETKAINKVCVREILSLSFVCGAYLFEFRGRNLVCFVIAYNFNSKYAPETGKKRMRSAFFTRLRAWDVWDVWDVGTRELADATTRDKKTLGLGDCKGFRT